MIGLAIGLADSAWAQDARNWPDKPVHVVVPLVGRLWSRHVVFDGYRSGLPLASEAHVWMVRDERGACEDGPDDRVEEPSYSHRPS